MENIETGLLLMVVGMATVFAILLIVIYLGKGLIAFVNKYIPEEIIVKKRTAAVQSQSLPHTQDNSMPGATTAAIVSAISVLTGGKGKVIKIEK
ncbi:oxaloacetate decarboxylase gamma subunit [Parabacteroides sp. PF5-5]|uniref:OadG family protein n=1 Tax=unclassified Parabacteroides TaxID=2649774 RepID=UPI0024769C8A|nr:MULTISPECIES: OadG family protein [unclassified Parabacteroides]MDH6304964.1 oxaloacetate decarboxylase gamma subunit [Parabacteroides sp. PH5-39]MDH6315950.1 oxaloacetate decarboxylase gamma subunit [Parabacteroides sp. PF5-13]MDH6319607.1 oxaloacetate decarboxylase gamma subunit [Parabacteroides sp. PH5-13]MDH6323338.1 oxaloacetate decarboxylase gamma subunit [Parabacteroides sp. PH5-8]MDH6327153.1 oxaloacetate decarboxylase gamma subunit [Parabacteroides sp. PH5-41]